MCGIAAILRLDGRTVERPVLERMAASLTLDQLAPLSQDTDLAFLLVDVDAMWSMAGLSSPRR